MNNTSRDEIQHKSDPNEAVSQIYISTIKNMFLIGVGNIVLMFYTSLNCSEMWSKCWSCDSVGSVASDWISTETSLPISPVLYRSHSRPFRGHHAAQKVIQLLPYALTRGLHVAGARGHTAVRRPAVTWEAGSCSPKALWADSVSVSFFFLLNVTLSSAKAI